MKQPLKFRIWGPQNATCQVVTLEELAELEAIPSPAQVDQFTGMLDKYNQEIYVGDILRCRDYYGEFYHQPVDFSIRGSIAGDETDDVGYLQIPHNREVVGNMRQTPELCQDETDDL